MAGIINKIKSIPQGVKSSAALIAAQIVSMGISYITVPLFTRLLTTDEYGQVNVFVSWVSLFGIVAMFGLAGGVFNNGMVDYPDKRDEFSLSMLALSNVITVTFFVVLFALYPLIKDWLGLDWKLILLMCILFLCQPAYNFWSARQRYELKYKALFITSVLFTVLTPAVALLCVVNTSGSRATARIYGMECVSIFIYVIFYVLLFVKGQRKVTTKYWKSAFLFNLPLLPHFFSFYILGSSDRLMISRMVSDSATAFYSVANSVSSIAGIVWSAVQASIIPFTYEHCKRKDYKPIAKVTLPVLAVVAAFCVVVIMLAPEVVAILATADYKQAIYAIPPIVGGVFFQTHHGIYANIVFYYKKPKYTMYASITAAVTNLILNFIFIPIFGFIAAGYTTLFSYFLQAVIDYFAMRKVLNGETVYNMKYIGALSLGVIVVALGSNLIYDYAPVRYGIIVATLAVAIIFRKKIIGMFKLMRTKS